MSYRNNMRNLVLKTREQLKGVDAKIKELEGMKSGYYQPTYEEKMRELTRERDEILRKSEADARDLLWSYQERVHNKFTPHGEDLTSDVDVLKNFELSVDEMREMLDKYEDNPTMRRLVCETAQKRGIKVFDGIPDEASYMDAGNTMHSYFKSAVRSSDHAMIFENDSYFEKVSNGCMD